MSTQRDKIVITLFRASAATVLLAVLAILLQVTSITAQKFDRLERGRAKDMLGAIKGEIKSKYFDANYKGVDIETKFAEADKKLDTAKSIGQAFGIIAQAVLELNDSHTRFFPPQTTTRSEYGFRMQMIGDKCLIVGIKPGSDAEKQLKMGDHVVSIEGFQPNRRDLWKMNYYFNVISPRLGLNLKVQSPNEKEPRELNVAAKVTRLPAFVSLAALIREFELDNGTKVEHRFARSGNTVIWKMPSFMIEPDSIDNIMKSRIANAPNLILDLRGNGGGLVISLERLAGYFVDKDTKIADLKGRKEMKPQMAKTRGTDVFRGKLVILLDSNSGSASEIFARFMQLQERGVVMGDRSAGAVMQSQSVPMQTGVDSIIPFGMSLTNADVIMSDGVSLEHTGVTPQFTIITTGAELAAKQDKVLAAALELLGQPISPDDAGKMFPYKWPEDK